MSVCAPNLPTINGYSTFDMTMPTALRRTFALVAIG